MNIKHRILYTAVSALCSVGLFVANVTTMNVNSYAVSSRTQYAAGDANHDGKVNIRDAAFIAIKIAKGDLGLLPSNADYNNDGMVNIRDAAAIAIHCAKVHGVDIYDMLELVNKEREKVGVAPLKINVTLNKLANERACELAYSFSHKRLTGDLFSSIFDEYGVDYSYCGENLAAGNLNAAATVKQFVNSPEHYKNMIDPDFTEIGIGYYYDESSAYKYHWVQLFIDP